MDEKKEIKPVTEVKEIKETKEPKKVKETSKEEMELIIAYAQVALYTLRHSSTEITPKAIREEIKMFYNKFGNDDVKKLANTFMKEKKEKKEKR